MVVAGELAGTVRRGLAQGQASLVQVARHTPLRPKHTVIIEYTAPKSGRQIRLPVWAVRAGEDWIVGVGASEIKTWWKAFRRPVDATLDDGAGRHEVAGQLVTDPAERAHLLEIYYRTIPSAHRQFGAEPPVLRFHPGSAASESKHP